MNYTQFLLTKLAEEAAEIIQAALKAQQFGLRDEYQGKTNALRLEEEIVDFTAVVILLEQINALPQRTLTQNSIKTIIKMDKIAHWRKYSEKLGYVSTK